MGTNTWQVQLQPNPNCATGHPRQGPCKTNTKTNMGTPHIRCMVRWPALEHYRCFMAWATRTRQLRVVNQVMWFPVKAFPCLNNIDLLRAAVEDAVEILQNPPTETFAGILPSTNQSQLIEFFNTIQQQPRVDAKHTNANKPHAQPLGVPTQGAPPTGPRRSQRLMTGVSASAINPDTGKAAEYREL